MKYRVSFCMLVLLLLFRSAALAVNIRDVAFVTGNAGKVVFSHAKHMDKKGLARNCRACHDAIFDLKKKTQYTMSDMQKGRSCGACHDGNKGFPLAECTRCHLTRDILYNVKATGPTVFRHRLHLATMADCGICHPSVFAAGPNKRFTMAEMEQGKSCGACHNGTKAFGLASCETCHSVKEITFKVKETGPIRFSHKSHSAAASCGKCHPALYAPNLKNRHVDMAAMEKGRSCGACHNSKQAFPVKECTKCHPVRELLFEEKSTGNVVFSHTFHTGLYTCVDCHTSRYTTTRSKARVSMQEMEKGKSCGGCHDGKTAFSVKDKCESCHKM